MRVGLALPQFDYSVPGERPLRWETVERWARAAEEAGLDSVWLADHLFLSIEKYGAPPGDHEGYDPLVALGALARVTRRVRLGTLVLCAQLRPATVLAKQLASIDVLSGGRLEIGLGAGWFEPEYRLAGVPFERPGVRLAQLADTVDTVGRVLGGGPPPVRPGPVQTPRPPIWVGGRGDRLLELVARSADGWNTVWAMTPEAYRARLTVLERACERVGRDPATVRRSLGLYTLVGEDERDLERRWERLRKLAPPGVLDGVELADWRRDHLVGTVEQVREQAAGWADLGVELLVVGLGAVPFGVTDTDDLVLVASALS